VTLAMPTAALFARRVTRKQHWLSNEKQETSEMEMHSRRSLHEIHGVSAPLARQLRQPPIARRAIAQILLAVRTTTRLIEARLAAKLLGRNRSLLAITPYHRAR